MYTCTISSEPFTKLESCSNTFRIKGVRTYYGKYMAHTNRKVARSSRIINNAFWKCFSILIKYKV